ncbi:MAG: ATP-binding protein [Kiritimatiellae bacterium]|nr:ATP-binding protein [Kiritimatiellia bacterium]
MSTRRKIPYGVMNYEKLVRECYFVDNTAYIRELENVETPVFLRPKRFGKSVWCSVLAHYYDVNLKDRFQELFGETDIGRDPTPLANSFLVLRFNFSTIEVGSLAEIERNFFEHVKMQVGEFAVRYAALADWSAALKAENPAMMIDRVRNIVRANNLPPIYVIIDEYDNFTNELVVSNRDAEYDAICGHDNVGGLPRDSFFKAFFKSFKAGLEEGNVGRTYFTGVLPITLDDLSSGFNVGTVVSLNRHFLGMVGFTASQISGYVDRVFADYGFDPSIKPRVLADIKAFHDGYHFIPGAEPLYNSTTCNWYLFNLVSDGGMPSALVIDANVRTDVGWIRRLAGSTANALERVRAYVERGEGESASYLGLSSRFGRVKFFSKEFYPYALYYLGLLTFEDGFSLAIPNLTIRNMFVDYYDELSAFTNEDEARRHFIGAARDLVMNGGTWKNVFEQFWQYYVKARIPAQAYDKMNENFFRTTFASRTWDALPMFYTIEIEYNTPAGRCDFLAVPKPGLAKDAMLVEFKYFTKKDGAARLFADENRMPDAETFAQAERYRASLPARPGWNHAVETAVVEVYADLGYRWFPV